MDGHFGYSSFVLLVSDAQHDLMKDTLERFKDFTDIVREYAMVGEKYKYWYVQLDVMDYQRDSKELCHFVYTYFDFIALRQGGSSWILVPDKDNFKKALSAMYTKEQKIYYLYDMLTIGERYDAIVEYKYNYISPYGDTRLLHTENGNMYSLVFGRECVYLFSDEPEVTLEDTTTGLVTSVDITDGIEIFDFNIAILR